MDLSVQLYWRGSREAVQVGVAPLLAQDLAAFRAVIAPRLLDQVASSWARGWQPVEVVRHVRRGCGPPSVRLLLVALAVDRRGRVPTSLDPRWVAQLDALDLPSDLPPDRPAADDHRNGLAAADAWLRGWMAGEDAGPVESVLAALDLLVRLLTMPVLESLLPPPGAGPDWLPKVEGPAGWGSGGAHAGAEADPVLEKVRALLAKAESTSFEAEAEAFTAKAQELIARHAIDVAVLATDDADGGPSAIRMFIDDPYADAKSLLLQVVAESGRCRAAYLTSVAMSTVVGFASDLAAVELMFTSLLVQAQSAMAAAARSAPPGARTRSRGYRSAFLQSYASRIGQRLEEINAAVVAEADADAASGHGRSILPVLASRDEAVDHAVADLFGELTTHRLRGGDDPAGWASGRFAADNAHLGGGFVESGS